MKEKTAQLRDIFLDVTQDTTVTEKQEESRGSLTEDEREITAKLRETIERMRDQLSFDTDLSVDAYETVVRGFYDDIDDTALADRIDCDRETVIAVRHDLHLLREQNPPFDAEEFRQLLTEDRTDSEIAEQLDTGLRSVSAYRRVVEIQEEIRRVNARYTDVFEELLTDADLEEHTEDVTETGLDDATDGMETNVSM